MTILLAFFTHILAVRISNQIGIGYFQRTRSPGFELFIQLPRHV